jgi:hypothetical protein
MIVSEVRSEADYAGLIIAEHCCLDALGMLICDHPQDTPEGKMREPLQHRADQA